MRRESFAADDPGPGDPASAPLHDNVIDEIDGRRIRIGRRWLTDFASCNYLGFDLEPQIVEAVDAAVRRWGAHPSWSRLLGNPRPYVDIEERLTALLGWLYAMTAQLLSAVDELGLATPNRSGLPIVELPLAAEDDLTAVWQFLVDRGVYTTPAAYPLVPRADVGFRIQVTAANTPDQIEELCDVLRACATRFRLRTRSDDGSR